MPQGARGGPGARGREVLPECQGGRPMGLWPLVRAERTFLVPSGPDSLTSTVSLPVGSTFPVDRAVSRPLPPLLVEADPKNGQKYSDHFLGLLICWRGN